MKYINALIYSNHPVVRLARHLLFWIADIINWMLVVSIGGVPKGEIPSFLLSLPIAICTTYILIYFILPKFSAPRDKGKLFMWIIGVLVIFGVVLRLYKVYIVFPWLDMEYSKTFDAGTIGRLIREIFSWLAVIGMAIIIKLVKNKSELIETNDQLLIEKRTAELSFLKAQMHPHFLFNTLNTLYSETIHNSPNAQQIVLDLSSLLRFILEECNKPVIQLSQEIKVIKNYIALEKLRHGNRLEISFKLPTDGDPLISPLIFLPFIENSFKHSLNNVRGVVNINIVISTDDAFIKLFVENDYVTTTTIANNVGKGIANVRRQLDLIYENTYKLVISDGNNKYQVSLLVPLKPL